MEIYHNALFKHILLWAPAALVIFKSSQQAVETLIPFVTVHMSNWQSAHSVRQGKKKIYLMSAPQGDMRFDWQKAESGFWSCVLTSSSSSCLFCWTAPHCLFKQKWQATALLSGSSLAQWELRWRQRHWLNRAPFFSKTSRLSESKLGRINSTLLKEDIKLTLSDVRPVCTASGIHWMMSRVRNGKAYKARSKISYDNLGQFPIASGSLYFKLTSLFVCLI